jgi:hypothetical protein
MSKSAIVPLSYWVGEGDDARIVRAQGVRVVLYITHDGHPSMHVDRPPKRKLTEADEYEDELMDRWNRAVLAEFKGGQRK